MSNVLVFIERREGQIKRPSLEVVTTARALAAKSGGEVHALVFGPDAAQTAADLGRYGVDRLHHVEDPSLAHYVPEVYGATLAETAKQSEAGVVLAAATAMGKDVTARAAARCGTACASDVVEIELESDGKLRVKRPVYSGKAFARVAIPTSRPCFATLRPNVFAATPVESAGEPECSAQSPAIDPSTARARATELKKPAEQELDVSEASIIVSGGRGLKEPDNFSLVRELAQELGAAVGASRAVVDAGWIDHSRQVGQTGKVVSPKLYIAVGISGAVQHLAGMSSSEVIVAINKDPEAPIFKVADFGIVGDLFDVVPALTREVRKSKD